MGQSEEAEVGKIRTVIVGCGAIAQVHAKVLSRLQDCQLTAFADCKVERAQAMTETYGGKAYASLEEMMENEKIDVLHICTPHYLHTPMAILALQNHIHVFMEKPPVISKDQLQQLAAAESERQLGICFQNRYNPSIIKAREILASGEAGKILCARGIVTWHRDKEYYQESDWRGVLALEGGGALINQSIHTLDLLQYIIGMPPRSIHAVTTNHHLQGLIEVEDTMSAWIQYEDVTANFYATTSYLADPPPLIEFVCERMTIRIEELELSCYYPDGTVVRHEASGKQGLGKSYWGTGHEDCIRAFYDSISQEKQYPLNLAGVWDTIRLMLGAYESSRIGKVVSLGQ